MISLKKPNSKAIQRLLSDCRNSDFTYMEVGKSKTDEQVNGFDNDFNKIYLGSGKKVYSAACQAIRNWSTFPGGWITIRPQNVPIESGQTVVMVAKIMGLYWLNACRIVYILNKQGNVRKYGFAYGTLPQHVEKGEELFCVEWLEDDSVWYSIRAFSRPRFWLVRLTYPLARYFQKKFVKESMRSMQKAVENNS